MGVFLMFFLRTKLLITSINPFTTNALYHIETSQLICNANQLTGFHTKGNIGCQVNQKSMLYQVTGVVKNLIKIAAQYS